MATEILTRPENMAQPHPVGGTGSLPGVVPADVSRTAPVTVIYDDECGVCRETVHQLRRWDHEERLEFVPFSAVSTSGRPVLERLAAEGLSDDAIHVVDQATGRVIAGGHAALAIIDALPGGWLLRPWAGMPHTALAADVVYRVASRHRDRLAWLVGLRDDVRCPLDKDPDRGRPPADRHS